MSLQPTCLQRVAAGDRESMSACIERYGRLVWSLALRMLPTRESAEDAVQETFFELWQTADRFDPRIASEATFVTMIARRRLIDCRRRLQRELRLASLEGVREPATPTMADRLVRREELIRARQALAMLRPAQRQALQMSLCDGLTHQQIAERMEIPLGTVKSHIRRGLSQVRQLVASDGTRAEESAKP